MRRLWWIPPLALLALAAPGLGEEPASQADKTWQPIPEEKPKETPEERRWRPLREHTLKKLHGEQKYLVGWERSRGVRALRFQVEGSPVEMLRVEVHYAKGKEAQWTLGAVVPDQGASPELELDPSLSYVVKVYLEYRLQPPDPAARYDKKLKADVLLAGRP
jgi:hypothetical protein